MRTSKKSRSITSRRRKVKLAPLVERLEDRRLLAANNVFAQFQGNLLSSDSRLQIPISVTSADFALSGGKAVLGFQVQRDGGNLDPATVKIQNASGVVLATRQSVPNLAANTESLAIAELALGNYVLTVGGENGTTGSFRLNVLLAGDMNGDRKVDLTDATAVRGLLGVTSSSAKYKVEADANMDGVITSFDYTQARDNINDSTRIRPLSSVSIELNPLPTVLSDGSLITNASVVSVQGSTLPLVNVKLETGTDGNFDNGSSSSNSSGAYSIANLGLSSGNVTIRARAQDGFGQQAFSSLSLVVDSELVTPQFDLTAGSDSGIQGDQITSDGNVTFVGRTDPGASVSLLKSGIAVASTMAAGNGAFQFAGIPLTMSENSFVVQAVDQAGNVREFIRAFTRIPNEEARQNVILQWNNIALNAIRLDASAPPVASRALAMVATSMFDAVSAIDGTPGFLVTVSPPVGASAEAAAAAAAHRVLSYLYPAQQSRFDAELELVLSQIEEGLLEDNGVNFGRAIADATIVQRQNDGSRSFIDYVPVDANAGTWQPTAPAYAEALLPQWADVVPFALNSPDQFRPEAPPVLGSEEYAAAFNEVKSKGRAAESTRTEDESHIAQFWADGLGTSTPPGHWVQIAMQLADSEGYGLSASARLFAQLNVALADAAISSWDAKFAYGLWRPITAITEAAIDGNIQTEPDPQWTPFLVTPNFPTYTSGHSTFSGAAQVVLESFFGNTTSFTTSTEAFGIAPRTFANFAAAAEEAGRSRILGGIHFDFDNRAGLSVGREVGTYVLDAFSLTSDTRAPVVNIAIPASELVTSTNFVIHGQAIDNLSGVKTLEARIDSGDFFPVTFSSAGNFSVPTAFTLDGTADGMHNVTFRATDFAKNASQITDVSFVLDTLAPNLSLTSPVELSALAVDSRLAGIADGTGSSITSLTYAFDGLRPSPIVFDPTSGEFDQILDVSKLSIGDHRLVIIATDAAGNETSSTLTVSLAGALPLSLVTISPTDGATDVGSTQRPKVTFSRPVDKATVSGASFFAADTTGAKIPATIVVSDDATNAMLFFTEPLPGASTITVTVDGSGIRTTDGSLLDAAGIGDSGSVLTIAFTTVNTTSLPGTTLTGILADPGADLKPGTIDDVRRGADGLLMTSDDVYLNPIVGAMVYVLGQESQGVITDAQGRFTLNVPSGNVKLVLNGTTATNAPAGSYFAEMTMDLTIEPGIVNSVMGSMGTRDQQTAFEEIVGVYLPRLNSAILQTVSNTGPTVITVPAEAAPDLTPAQRQLLTAEVMPGTAIGADGQVMTNVQIGISTVPPELIREMLPPGVSEPPFTITVQAPGVVTFTTPLQVSYPNVDNLAPGTKTLFISFDHASGRLVVDGTATVSADGTMIVTDPDSGLTHPGWHFISFGSTAQGASPNATAGRVDATEFQDFLVGPGQPPIFVTITTNPTDAQVSWTITPNGAHSGTVADNRGTTKEFSFTPDVTGVRPNYQGTGSRQPNPAISYTISYTVTSPREDPFTGTATITQNDRARLRQEYVDFGLIVPTLNDVAPSISTQNFDGTEFSQNSNYSPYVINGGMQQIAQSTRAVFGQPIRISSAYRNPQRNRAVGGVQNSVHMSGGAVDMQPSGTGTMVQLYRAALAVNPGQVLLEQGPTQLLPGNWSPPTGTSTFSVANATISTSDSDGDGLPDAVASIQSAPAGGIPSVTNLAFNGGGATNPSFRVLDSDNNGRIDPGEPLVLNHNGLTPLATYFKNASHVHADNRRLTTASSAAQAQAEFGLKAIPLSIATGFGTDPRFYYRIQSEGRFDITGRTTAGGSLSVVLAPAIEYRLSVYQASTNRLSEFRGLTNASGAVTDLGPIILAQFGGPDTDGDGIPDVGEFAIGTDSNSTDTDNDGISDSAELEQGLDPLSGRSFPTGVVATLPIQGNAEKIAVDGDRIYAATGGYGLAVIDGTQFNNPVVLGQLDLPGAATGVGVDGSLQLAAVATGSALQIVDVSDGTRPTLVRSVNVSATHVEVTGGLAYTSSGTSLSIIDLASGNVVQTLTLPGSGSVTAFAREGTFLYAFVSGSDTFSVIDIANEGGAVVRGQRVVSVASFDVGLFVGNGIAWLSGSGLRTIDVTNPTSPTIIQLPTGSQFFTARRIALNGSGLGLLLPDGGNFVQVYDTSNPSNVANLQLQLPLSANARDVAISRGLAYIAEGNRIEVVNYLPFDNQRVAPTVSINTSAIDIDLTQPGLQVVEGTRQPIRVNVADDRQVRMIELLLDGEVIQSDVAFPFDFSFIAPQIIPGVSSFALQVRATDTGGNTSLSNLLTIDLVTDNLPPTITGFVPPTNNSQIEPVQIVQVRFSEPMDGATVTADTVRVRDDAGNFLTPSNFQLRDNDRLAQLMLPPLLIGDYRIIVDGSVSDRAGNALGGQIVSPFTLTPRATLSTAATDADPIAPGLQVPEGSIVPISVSVSAGVNVQKVELLVNGAIASTDTIAPYTFTTISPNISPEAPSFTLQAKVTDSLGISTFTSPPSTIGLIEDIVAPIVVSSNPSNGSLTSAGRTSLQVGFSEPLSSASLSPSSFRLVAPGPDNQFGSGDDVAVSITAVSASTDDTVQLSIASLSSGAYQLQVLPGAITDRAGNLLTKAYSSTFAARSDLLAYYPFEQGAIDESGNAFNGVVNGATPTIGYLGQGYSFNGTGNSIRLPLNINPSVLPTLTMGAWVKPTIGNPIRQIISHDNAGFDRSLGIDSRGGAVGWSTFAGSGAVLGSSPVTLNQWTFVAVAYDQVAAMVTLYVDGRVFQRAGSLSAGNTFTLIGSNPGFGEYFGGVIDNVFFVNAALTASQLDVLRSHGTSTGLVSRYTADGDATDTVGASNGILQNGAAFAPGKSGQAFNFDGNNASIQVSNAPPVTSAISVSAWINPEVPPAGQGWFYSLRSPFVSEGFSLAVLPNGALLVTLRTTTSPTIAGSSLISSANRISFGIFQNVVASYDSTIGQVKLFVNGVAIPLATVSGPSTLTGQLFPITNMFLGQRQSNATAEGAAGGVHYKGRIDDVQVFNRALTDAEVQSIVSGGAQPRFLMAGSGQPIFETMILPADEVYADPTQTIAVAKSSVRQSTNNSVPVDAVAASLRYTRFPAEFLPDTSWSNMRYSEAQLTLNETVADDRVLAANAEKEISKPNCFADWPAVPIREMQRRSIERFDLEGLKLDDLAVILDVIATDITRSQTTLQTLNRMER